MGPGSDVLKGADDRSARVEAELEALEGGTLDAMVETGRRRPVEVLYFDELGPSSIDDALEAGREAVGRDPVAMIPRGLAAGGGATTGAGADALAAGGGARLEGWEEAEGAEEGGADPLEEEEADA